ncbi:biotin transporter BioY [Bartonella sp. TP]|uniref:biotin transporter BioY n=1 Tax=Bartonella sp. TP TaxID=3057550 RepID=UPI0025B090D7|nr:biotin transporter BioY [Bartonella sp. TP]WJW79562.1 biotin transporter BioY [Bartonella sp. TP]
MRVKDITAVALFVALIAAMGKVPPLVFGPVPITAQTLAVMLTGAILQPKYSLITMLVFLIIVAFGIPLMASGQGGLTVFTNQATGYVLGWVPGALCISMLYKYSGTRLTPLRELTSLAIGGIFVIHLCGIAWFVHYLEMPLTKAFILDSVYLPGDIIKIIIAYLTASNLRKALPQLFRRSQLK